MFKIKTKNTKNDCENLIKTNLKLLQQKLNI